FHIGLPFSDEPCRTGNRPTEGTDNQPASSRVILKGSVLNARARRVRSESALADHEQMDVKKPRECEADIQLV
ncbi:hypothetical protein QIG67_28845, partial [Klebsiella pneumoniae]|nr:hypothetical protein [Klebsiella pneumoniae]